VDTECRDQYKRGQEHSGDIAQCRNSIQEPCGPSGRFPPAIVESHAHRSQRGKRRDRDKIKEHAGGYQLCRKIIDVQVHPITDRVAAQAVEKKRTAANAHQHRHNPGLNGERFAAHERADKRSRAERCQERRDKARPNEN
jgi:hypothetical protein